MITVENLQKKYGDTVALKGISFSIKEGEFYGLLGPNGAGKTTTISIISTILPADKGTVTIGGMDLAKNQKVCKRMIGVVPQEIALYDKMSAVENLRFWGSLYDVDSKTLNSRIDELLKLFGLYDRRNDKIKAYSGGMKRRINIASSLLHQPRILFMDEPTVGIDPQSRNLIFEVIEKLHRDGMTIIYTTHYMEEAERFCDRIGIIDNGEILTQGTLHELREFSGIHEAIKIRCASISEDQARQISSSFGENVTISENLVVYSSKLVGSDLPRVITRCAELQLPIEQVEIQKVNLETIFLHLTGKQLRD